MPSTATDRLQGLTTSVAVKAPCAVAATANLTLAGEQTIAGRAVVAGDRVLAAGQTAAAARLIYVVDTGPWSIAPDSDGPHDLVSGSIVLAGTATPDLWEFWVCRTSVAPVVPGSTALVWEKFSPQDLALEADSGGIVNVLAFCASEAQKTGILDMTFAEDHTAVLVAALDYANGRPIKMPAGGYRISAAVLDMAGTALIGDGWGRTIIRSSDATQNLFTVTADNVQFVNLEMQGAATAAVANKFAVFTDVATPARGLKLHRVKITGQASTHGFANGVKFDENCDYGVVSECWIDRLWGTASGFGYGVLCGDVAAARIRDNWMFGAAGRGRHAVYLSGGANGCIVSGNYIEAFNSTCITQFSQSTQPPCTDNIIEGNRVVNGAAATAATSAGISVEGHSLRTKVRGNFVIGSLSCGIRLDGTTFTDLKDTEVSDNDVIGSALIGIDLVAAVGGKLSGNFVKDSSAAAAGVSANVRFISDGTTGTSAFLVTGNRIPASATARSGFQTNTSLPAPSGLRFDGNQVGAGTVSDYEFLGLVFTVDGMRRVSIAHNWAAIANGASFTQTFTPAELADMPAGANVEATYTGNTDGMVFEVQVLVTGTPRVTLANLSGSSKTASGGSVVLTWTGAI